MDKDPLQCRIYFLTFVESLEMIFSEYTQTCEVILDYPEIGGEYFFIFFKKRPLEIFCMQKLMYTAKD